MPADREPEELDHEAQDPLEDLVLECLESSDFDAAIEELAGLRPADADRIRRIAARLRSIDGGIGPLPPAPPATPAVGDIPGFRLIEKLGEGGMGVVYRAEQATPRREVALKVIRPAFLHFSGARERFEREVEACAQLDHPSIVPVLEVGADAGVPWFSMGLVRGSTLADLLDELRARDPRVLGGSDLRDAVRGSVDPTTDTTTGVGDGCFRGTWVESIVALVAEIAGALQHAHGRGVFHRDVKPSNIIVTPAGRAMLLDFGLAVMDDAQRLTGTRAIIGSLPYLAPELVRGEAPASVPAARLDVYALGVTLYEACALHNPFLGPTAEATRKSILAADPVPLRRRNPRVSRDLELVCATAMAESASRRYASMAEFAADLRAVLEGRVVSAVRETPIMRALRYVRRNRLLVGAAAAIVLITSGAAAVSLWLYGQSEELRIEAEQNLAAAADSAHMSALAFANDSLGNRRITRAVTILDEIPTERRGWEWRHLVSRLDLSERTRPLGVDPIAIDAAVRGGRFAIASAGSVSVRDRSGALFREVEGRQIRAAAIAPDGSRVTWSDLDGVWVLELGAAPTADASTAAAPRRVSKKRCLSLDFDPAGRAVVGGARDGTITRWELGAAGAGAAQRRSYPLQIPQSLRVVKWSPDGGTIAFGGDSRSIGLIDTQTGVQLDPILGHRAPIVALDFSNDGTQVVSASMDRTVRIWDVATRAQLGFPLALRDMPTDVALQGGDDDEVLVAVGESIIRWSVRTGLRAGTLHGHLGTVLGARWMAASSVRSVAVDGTLRTWNAYVESVPTIRAHGHAIECLAMSPRGGLLASVTRSGPMRVFASRTRRLVYDGSVAALYAGTWVEFDATGEWLVHVGLGYAVVLRVSDWAEVVRLDVPGESVLSLHFTPDRQHAVVATARAEGGVDLALWDTATWTEVRSLGACPGVLRDAEFLDDGRTFLAGTDGGLCTFAVLQPSAAATIATAPSVPAGLSTGIVESVTLDPTGARVAIVHRAEPDAPCTVTELDATDLGVRARYAIAEARHAVFDPSGERLLVGGAGGLIHVCGDGRVITRLESDGGASLVEMVVDAEAGAVATGDTLGELRVWSAVPPAAVDVGARDLTRRAR